MHKFPKAGFTEVVRPNLDTYYSVIYADLGKSPLYFIYQQQNVTT